MRSPASSWLAVSSSALLGVGIALCGCPSSGTSAGKGRPSTTSPYTPLSTDAGVCASNADCDDGIFCNGDELCIAIDPRANAQGCVRPLPIRCHGGLDCNESADVCEVHCAAPDADGDGHRSIACDGDDCDDHDANSYPGNPEVCDSRGHDEDCNPSTLGPMHDGDGDGEWSTGCCNKQPSGTLLCGLDCDDTRAQINATAVESCNNVDDNCNGMVDEGLVQDMYKDDDHDGWGDGPKVQLCPGTAGYANVAGDCDDTNAEINPGQAEVCDNVDNDCDLDVDEGVSVGLYTDADQDGYGARGAPVPGCPGKPGYSTLGDDCDDNNPAIVPGAIICATLKASSEIETCESTVDGGVPDGGVGSYVKGLCPAQELCHPQPNGTGVCF
jgi:hypothetical protein